MSNVSTLLIAAAAAAFLNGATPADAQNTCLGNAQIQQMVSAGQILPLNEILAHAGLGRGTKVLPPVKVCSEGGALYYQLKVLDGNGAARNLNLNATTGQP